MKTILSLLTSVSLIAPTPLLWAADESDTKILIQGPQVSADEYRVFLNLNPQYTSYASFIQNSGPSRAEKERLQQLATEGQRSFLQDPAENAIEQLKLVTQMALSADWGFAQRQMIFEAYLRAAQLTENENAQKSLIQQAICFDPEQTPNQERFAPPFQSAFQKARLLLAPIYWNTNQATNAEVVLINGRAYSHHQKVQLCQQKYRFTLISNALLPYTTTALPRNIRNRSSTLVEGNCKIASSTASLPLRRSFALFPESCVNDLSQVEPATPVVQVSAPLPQKNWAERNWFWIGLSAVGTFILVSEMDRRSEPTPSHRDGFGTR